MKAEAFLAASIANTKAAHAYLFAGNDEERKERALSDFLRQLACAPADILRLAPEGKEIKVGQIRSLHRKLQFAPYESPWKAAVIEQAHTATREAQSALLKLLEEPPAHTVLAVKTAYPRALLAPVRSRLLELPFYDFQEKPAGKNELERLLQSSLSKRFEYAKKNEENALVLLENWMRHARRKLGLQGEEEQARVLALLHEARESLTRTNRAARGALEYVLLSV